MWDWCQPENQPSAVLIKGDSYLKVKGMLRGIATPDNDGKRKPGYDALDIVGVNPQDEGFSLLSLYSYLYSETQEIDSLKNRSFDRIIDIIIHTNNRSTFVFDRGFDDRKVIKQMSDHDASFIIRMKTNRLIIKDSEKMKIGTVGKTAKLRNEYQNSEGTIIHAGCSDVEVPLDPNPRKKPTTAPAKLIIAKLKNKNKKERYKEKEQLQLWVPWV